jgi:N12 class adenine-specific DNA methylase
MQSLRPYQIKLSTEASQILIRKKLVFLAMQVRTGKSLTALQTCKNVNAKRVLFITKIKAFSSIQNDYDNFGYDFDLTIINRESLHKIESNDFDVVVIDEVHGYATYPKPSIYQKEIKKRFGNIPMIFLSGTPTPESYSQFYHIFTLSNHGPFREYANFYEWFHSMGCVAVNFDLGYGRVNNYSNNKEIITEKLEAFYKMNSNLTRFV